MKLSYTPFRLGLFIALTGCILVVTGCGKDKSDTNQPDQIYEVIRGDFNIVVSVQGVLDAVKRYVIEAPSFSRQGLEIIEAVPDQTALEAGDLIVKFSDEVYLEQLENETVELEEDHRDLMVLEQDYQIAIADIVSSIKNATDNLRQSREAYERYVYEDAPLEKESLMRDVETARVNLADEKANLAALRTSLLSTSMGDEAAREQIQNQIDSSEQSIEELKRAEERAVYNLRIFKQYTFPEQSRRLEQGRTKSEMDLQKQLVNAAAQRVQLDVRISAQRQRVDSQERRTEQLIENIAMLEVRAPVAGTISYGDPNPRRRYGEQKEIIVGTTMNRREVIGSIPDLSQLIVNVDIPEATRSKISTGMHAEMRIKALPNLQLSGVVSKISDMATNLIQYDQSSPKIYPTVIRLDQTDSDLRPGMTVEVDMISEVISDVLFVPVEALYVKEGEVFCNVMKATGSEVRKVTIGKSSSNYVEIVEGLKEGERVILTREES